MIISDLIKDNITTAEELIELLNLSDEELEGIREEIAYFPMSITPYYLSLIDPGDPDDPIRKMAVPSGRLELEDGELDTSGEQSNTVLPGLQHKYAETAAVLTTSVCSMMCRHCFRRRMVGKDSDEVAADIGRVIDYIKDHPEINNVLLTGGDSFLLSTEKIGNWLEELSELEQLDFIRFGTRTPVTSPDRILGDEELLDLLEKYGNKKQIYVATHYNHPREFTEQSIASIRALQEAGVAVKNQTVLMKGVNDDADVLSELLRLVSAHGIVQHYIFQCRPVKGVKSRFQIPISRGYDIVREASSRQNGLGKAADYTLSHPAGKIRIIGRGEDGKMIFQYKQAKEPERNGYIFTLEDDEFDKWLPEELKH